MKFPRRRLLTAVAVAAAAALLVIVFERTSTAGPAASQRRGHTAGAAEAFVFAEESGDTTTYWLADAQNPSVRKRLATVAHHPGHSGEASLSPDGHWLAYTALPPSAGDPDHQAELWLLRIGGGARRLDAGVDLLSFLVWSPDGASVTFDQVTATGVELWRQAVAAKGAQRLAAATPSAVVIPAGYDREGTVLIGARLGPDGTDVVRVAPAALSVVSHAGDGAGRDFVLSPDRSHLAYLAVSGAGAQAAYEARAVSLTDGSSQTYAESGAEDVGVAWQPGGALSIGSVGATRGLRTANAGTIFPKHNPGFEQPLAWSPSGTRLAVRQFAGSSAADPGAARDLVIESDGARRSITAADPVRFVGWIGG